MGATHEDALQASIGQVWPYLDFEGKTKGGFRQHFGPLFWQDLWCDCFITNWLWKKSGVFLTTPCSEEEEGPRQRMCIGDMSSQLDPIRPAHKSRSTWCTSLQPVSPKIVELIQLVVYNTQLKVLRLGNSISSSPTLRLCLTQWRKRHCCLTKAFKSW